jgi:hypothetical protein
MRSPFALFLLLFLCAAAAAQPILIRGPKPSLKDVSPGQVYASKKDGFSIRMFPDKVFGYFMLSRGGTWHDSDGMRTEWETREATIMVDHWVFKTPMTGENYDLKKYTAAVRTNIEEEYKNLKFIEFVSESRLSLKGMNGIEFDYKDAAGNPLIFRAFTTGTEEFIISATVNKNEPNAEKLVRAIIESFDRYSGGVAIIHTGEPENFIPSTS